MMQDDARALFVSFQVGAACLDSFCLRNLRKLITYSLVCVLVLPRLAGLGYFFLRSIAGDRFLALFVFRRDLGLRLGAEIKNAFYLPKGIIGQRKLGQRHLRNCQDSDQAKNWWNLHCNLNLWFSAQRHPESRFVVR
jgi:hypothetical protein